jgi:hypothetical protein
VAAVAFNPAPMGLMSIDGIVRFYVKSCART